MIGASVLAWGGGEMLPTRDGEEVRVRRRGKRVVLEAKTLFSDQVAALIFSVTPAHFFTPTCKL